eukprot:gene3769-6657_t
MEKIKLACVPEHFSIPLHEGVESGIFKELNLDVEIQEYSRGTGSMCKGLQNKKVDVAIALTEGLISDLILNKSNFKIIGTYVDSSLCWGYISEINSPIKTTTDLKGKNFGISRFGSGSHIMSYLLSKQNGWNTEKDITFKVKGGLGELLDGIYDGSTDTFLWERFMLKQFVVEKKVKYVGEIVTPWPCFMIAATDDFIASNADSLVKLMKGIQKSCENFKTNKKSSLESISKKCTLDEEDSNFWFNEVQFIYNEYFSRMWSDQTNCRH